MTARKLLSSLLIVSLVGCGAPFYVTTEPRSAEVYVDGKFMGVGAATVPTNGVVFNSYRVEARDAQGNVIDSTEVDLHFGARSAVFAGVGLLGILVWPLLPLLPAAFFVGEPSPERVHLRVPLEDRPAPPPPPRPDEMDRPVIEFSAPAQGEQLIASATLTLRGHARHWSGVRSVKVELDGKPVKEIDLKSCEQDVAFEAPLTLDAPGDHIIKVTVQGVRGAAAQEEVRVTRRVK